MVTRVLRPPALGRVRLAVQEDAPKVMTLIGDPIAKTFRIEKVQDILYLIEHSILSITQLDIYGAIVGFLSAKDHPLIPSVHPKAWEEYIWTKYKTNQLNSRNTLFIHLLCWDTNYSRDIVDNMLKSIFMHDPYIHYIAITKTMVHYSQLVPGQSRSEASFKRVQVMERGLSGDQLPALCIAYRREVSPRLRIRRAVEEDNDDIVPIIERQSARLRQLYGEFYVSELVSRHPESERVLLVCEHKELAVGVMCLNTVINYEALEQCFDLSPFAGLRHLSGKTSYRDLNKSVINVSNISHATVQMKDRPRTSNIEITKAVDRDGKPRMSRVSDDHASRDIDIPHWSPFGPLTYLDVLNLVEDEDELEYDIVNIEDRLLRLPSILPFESTEKKSINEIKRRTWDRDSITSDKLNIYKKSIANSDGVGGNLSYMEPEAVHYQGAPNAFLLELFAIHPNYDERYGFDILETVFEIFPNREYCVLCLPSNHAAFPLLEHFTLVTPFGSRLRFINESLYVAYINSVRGNVCVRRGEAYDLPAVSDILERSTRRAVLLDLFQKSLKPGTFDPYVLLSEHQPVGIVIVGPLEDCTTLRTQYDMSPESMRPAADGAVLAGVVSPVLEPHMRWYMREVLRQSEYTTLFWLCRLINKGDVQTNPGRNLMSLLSRMMPVRPRRCIPNLTGDKTLEKTLKDNMSTLFALWTVDRPLTCMPKVDVNNKILVVGASLTALSFLENLLIGLSSQYLTFSNVTLVSERGISAISDCLHAAETCVPCGVTHLDRYLKTVPFYAYVDVACAVMVGINRKNKYIILNHGGVMYYDELVLTCGQQFQHPHCLNESLERAAEVAKDKPCERILMDNPKYQPDCVPPPPEPIDNLILINSLYEANLYLTQLKQMIRDAKDTPHELSAENPVVVYGECVDAYSCIAALLELEVAAENIVFVEHFPQDDTALRVNCFNNELVDRRVQDTLKKLGIQIYRQCTLISLRYRCLSNNISTLRFMCPMHMFSLPCFALFYYGLKAIDINAFKAINESGLVYDGGLIVGPAFDTNDPHIYAAGTCVRYSRSLYAKNNLHRYYRSEDVGAALATLFLRKLDPFVMGDKNIDPCPSDILPRYKSSLMMCSHPSIPTLSNPPLSQSRRWQPVKNFESPIVISATLPGPLYYMKVRKPGREIPMAVELGLPHQGHTLITDKHYNYFRLKLNVLHCVESVTLLSHKPFSKDIMSQLYGKHEAFFDKLLVRFMMNKIEDLYEYFRQPWLSVLHQETFGELICDIKHHEYDTACDATVSRPSCYNTTVEFRKETLRNTNLVTVNNEVQTEVETPMIKSVISDMLPMPVFDASSCDLDSQEQNLGTFRSIIEKFVMGANTKQLVNVSKPTDIPSECGQSESVRTQVAALWGAVGGEVVALGRLAEYLRRHAVSNPHYALLDLHML